MMKRAIFLAAGLLLACGSNGKDSVNSPANGQPKPGEPPEIVAPTPTSIDATCAGVMEGPFEPDDSIPAPGNIQILEDDSSVRLTWTTFDENLDVLGYHTEGYRVCWGTAEEGFKHGSLFPRGIGQLFGVKNGVEHVAVVQGIDHLGRVSAPSEVLHFKGDPARVNKLRTEMTAFFDDFNVPTGALDERRWAGAYIDIDPTTAFSFIGDQQHAINVIGNHSLLPGSEEHGGRAQTLMRPRPVFDFTGRTGRIVFDMGGTYSARVTWYVDVFPYATDQDITDATGHATFDPGGGHPGRFLRFSQSHNILRIHQHDEKGDPINLVEVDAWNVSPAAQLGRGIPLRNFELKVAKNYAAIYIDGQPILENTGINLDFEKSIMQWSIFGYNPAKISQRWVILPFDNFGYDGPPTPVVTHSYKMTYNATDWYHSDSLNDTTWVQPIPDSLDGATSVRFFYTVTNANYVWSADDKWVINGETIPFPEPVSPCGTWATGIIGDQPYSTSILLPPGLLKGGEDNTFTLNAVKSGVINVRVEANFTPGTEPAYTQPTAYVSSPVLPTFEPIGPLAMVNAINNQEVSSLSSAAHDQVLTVDTPLSGTVSLNLMSWSHFQELGFAQNLGIARLEVLVDGVPYVSVDTDATVATPEIDNGPETNYQFHMTPLSVDLDTTKLTNGPHGLYVRAYDSAGTIGAFTYMVDPELHVTVAN